MLIFIFRSLVLTWGDFNFQAHLLMSGDILVPERGKGVLLASSVLREAAQHLSKNKMAPNQGITWL